MEKSLSKKARKVIEENLEGLKGMPSLVELTKIGARMMLQTALEEEVCAYLERDYYERSPHAKGSRNGSKPRKVKTGCGDIEIKMPQVRDVGSPFHSLLLPPRISHMEEVRDIIPLLYMNGISSRKVKRAVGKLLGKKGLSHQNVLRISSKAVEEFNNWKRRDLSGLGVRADTKEKEALLVAWGFLEDMISRGLPSPLLAVIDGCHGLNKAVSEVLPDSDIQRCTKHRTENILNKVLKEDRDKVKESLRKIFYASTYEHAKEAVEIFKGNWGKRYPSALECLLEDIELCLTYYKYPYRHWKRIRTTNAVERSFREVRSRTRGIGRFKDEERALSMVYRQMKELKWYGVEMTGEARAILAGIKASKLQKVAA